MERSGEDREGQRGGENMDTDFRQAETSAREPLYRCAQRNGERHAVVNQPVSDVGVDRHQQRNCQANKGKVDDRFIGHPSGINHERLPKGKHARDQHSYEPTHDPC